jgi:ABC-type tungstate transport system substrate-binding protein
MKQIIVLVAMIALGVTIAAIIAGFGDAVSELGQDAMEKISSSAIGS